MIHNLDQEKSWEPAKPPIPEGTKPQLIPTYPHLFLPEQPIGSLPGTSNAPRTQRPPTPSSLHPPAIKALQGFCANTPAAGRDQRNASKTGSPT